MRQTFSIGFCCRESKQNKSGFSPVEMTIVINGDRVYMALPRKEKPSDFKKAYSSKKPTEIKTFCSNNYSMVQNKVSEMIGFGLPVTAKGLKDYIVNGYSSTYTLGMLKKDYLGLLAKRTAVDMGYESYRRYELAIDFLIGLLDKDMSLDTVSYGDILDCKVELQRKYGEGTAYGYLTKMKAFFRYAHNNGKLKVNPFANIKLKKVEKDIECMSDSDYMAMKLKDFGIDRLNKVRDLFILAANCGLAYCDLVQLKPEDFQLKDGQYIIEKTRKKTGVGFYSVVLPDGVEILEKYDFDISSLKLSNQKGNSFAKEIQAICNIKSLSSLTFHKMRHFYISRLVKLGIPIAIVQKCAGHKRIVQTQHYTHLTSTDVVNVVKEHL